MPVAALLALALAADAPPPMPDWAAMPPLRYLHDPDITPPMTAFVRDEVKAGRCVLPPASGSGPGPATPAVPGAAMPDARISLTVDVAVLVKADGMVVATIPHAIHCPTVEQYAAGLVTNFTRDNLVAHGPGELWYRTSVTFRWVP
ncbi:MAG: hypothetical protein ACRCSO_06560 [Sphingomonas sp.]